MCRCPTLQISKSSRCPMSPRSSRRSRPLRIGGREVAEPSKTRATYADLEAVPPHLVAEILDGSLVTHPRSSPRHGGSASALAMRLGSAFQFGYNGPGGWVFIVEPELHLGSHVAVPDIAGWRLENLPEYPK